MARPSKLNNQQVEYLIKDYNSGVSTHELAKRYGIAQPNILATLKRNGVETKSVGRYKVDEFKSIDEFVLNMKAKIQEGIISEEEAGKQYNRWIQEYEKRHLFNDHKLETPVGLASDLDKVGGKILYTPSEKGELYDSLCTQILEDLHNKKISKSEATLKHMTMEQDYQEMDEWDFNKKYGQQ